MPKYRIVFFGTPELSAEILEFLATLPLLHIVGIVSSPDARIGRKQLLTSSPVKAFAEKNHIPCLTPLSLKDENITPPTPLSKRGEKSPPDKVDKGGSSEYPNIQSFLKAFEADFFIVISYGKLLPKNILEIPKHGTYNLHFSLLPQFRGASPVQSAILAGEKESGITIFRLTEGLDEGDIYLQKTLSITRKYADEVFEETKMLGKQAFEEFFETFLSISPVPQETEGVSFCKKLKREDGEIFPEKEKTTEVLQKIHAFFPWPGTFFIDQKMNKRIKILRASACGESFASQEKAGTIFFKEGKCFLQLLDAPITLESLQPEGKRALSGSEFFAGYQKS